MINFTFAALTLGFASAGTYVPRTRAVLATIWHEALPMLVYSQVLIWGQSCMALMTVGFLRMGNPDISPFLGALVTMGLETGRDVMSFSSTEIVGEWADEVRDGLAESMVSTCSDGDAVELHKEFSLQWRFWLLFRKPAGSIVPPCCS